VELPRVLLRRGKQAALATKNKRRHKQQEGWALPGSTSAGGRYHIKGRGKYTYYTPWEGG